MSVDDKPGEATWVMFRRSWEKGVPFHAAVGRSDPNTDLVTVVHFAPSEKKKRAWWPEWTFKGRIKQGDFPDTVVPKSDTWGPTRGNEPGGTRPEP